MTTVFKNGPGFYAGATIKTNRRVKDGVMRLYLARLEAVDLPPEHAETDNATEFEVLFAQAENNPEVAHAMVQLHAALSANLGMLQAEADKG